MNDYTDNYSGMYQAPGGSIQLDSQSDLVGGPSEGGGGGGNVVGALINLIGSFVNANATKKAQQRQNRWNKQAAELQYQRDIEMWNMQNEYNSPANQYQRMLGSGLNPAQMYGGSGVSNTASNRPSYQAPTYEAAVVNPWSGLVDAINQYQQFRIGNAQIANLEQKTENDQVSNAILLQTVTGKKLANEIAEILRQRGEVKLGVEKDVAPYQKQFAEQKEELNRWNLVNASRNVLLKDSQLEKNEASTEKIRAEKLFQDHKNEFVRMGITTSDNPIIRVLVRMAQESGLGLIDFTPKFNQKRFSEMNRGMK